MKQKLIFLFLLVSIKTSISAQLNYEGATIGIKGGLNISKVEATNKFEQSLTEPLGGIYVSIPLSNNLFFQPELIYSKVAGRHAVNITNPDILIGGDWAGSFAMYNGVIIDIVFKYLDVPFMLKYRINKSHISLLTGLQASYLLSAKLLTRNEYYDVKSGFKEFDYRGILGVQYGLPRGFNISARYQLGLNNISTGDATFKINAFSFTLGYTLDQK